MLIRKKATESKPAFVPAVNFLGLDAKLMQQFQKLSHALNVMEDLKLPNAIAGFLRHLVIHTEPRELIHFAFLHNQTALYNTLREFIKLHMDKAKIPEALKGQFLDVASLFLTQAYCIYHEPNNMRHTNNRWSYTLSIDLLRVFRPFEVPVDENRKPILAATEVTIYEV